jgi:hypothetical protein
VFGLTCRNLCEINLIKSFEGFYEYFRKDQAHAIRSILKLKFWKSLVIWLWDGLKYVLIYAIGLFLAFLFSFYFSPLLIKEINIMGFTLNLLGLITTYIGIFFNRKLFNVPSFHEYFIQWLTENPLFIKRIKSQGRFATLRSVTKGRGYGYLTVPDNASITERLDKLEENIKHLANKIIVTEESFDKKCELIQNSINQETKKINDVIEDTDKKIMTVAIGDTSLQLLGLSWIISGMIISLM